MAFCASGVQVGNARQARVHAHVHRWRSTRLARLASMSVSGEKEEWDLELASPSKINLFLRILRRREDGYHDLASLFQAIALHDDLYISALPSSATEDEFYCDAPGVPSNKDNLVLKALNIFRTRTGQDTRFKVKLVKNVPVQAGLGGGSANAATALWGANSLCGKPASDNELADFGAEIGSDISFFFSSGTAYCTGRGEIFQSMDALRPTSLYIIKPKEGLSTGQVFKTLDLSKTKNRDPKELLRKLEEGSVYNGQYVNDLEEPSFQLCPKLADIKEACFEAGFRVVLMSGSGTAFFCLGEPMSDFVETFESKMKEYFDVQIYITRFVNRKAEDKWYFQ